MVELGACACLDIGPKHPDVIHELNLGRDEADGRYAVVDIWCALIDAAPATSMTAEAAYEYIQAAPWKIVGGSFYGHAGTRVGTSNRE
jgi:hypothetical protein